ncbi:MAG: site-2 protease family protein [Dehalococcoidia bacterium]
MDLTGGLQIARIRGIAIRVHWSWALIFTLLTWIVAGSYVEQYEGWSDVQAWGAGAATVVAFFLSVLLHELSHALVAQGYGMNVPSITLFIFGGVSNIATEMKSARQEFFVAAAGPGMSFLLAFVLVGLAFLVGGSLGSILGYLGVVNAVLGIFNMLPGFPLDGGRVFRSVIWARTGDLTRATRVAARVGVGIAWLMIGGGVIIAITVSLTGLWYVLIGLFLKQAAEAAEQQLLLERALNRVRTGELMRPAPEPMPESSSLQRIVDERVLARGERFVVLERDERITGILTTTDLAKVPRDDWATTSARNAMIPANEIATVTPSTPATEAVRTMAERDVHQLPVIEDGRLVGLLTRGDVLNQIQTRLQFGDLAEATRSEASRDSRG